MVISRFSMMAEVIVSRRNKKKALDHILSGRRTDGRIAMAIGHPLGGEAYEHDHDFFFTP